MKRDEYAPGLTVCTDDSFLRGIDCIRTGETLSPEPRRKDGDKSYNFYVKVRWRDGNESIVSLSRLKAVTDKEK